MGKIIKSNIPEHIISILACPDCRQRVAEQENILICNNCNRVFEYLDNNLISMMPSSLLPVPSLYFDSEYIEAKKHIEEILSYHYNSGSLSSRISNSYHKIINKLSLNYAVPHYANIDLGSGLGTILNYIPQELHPFWIGVDNNIELLKYVRKKHPKCYLIYGDLQRLPFKTALVKNIFSLAVLEHLFYLDESIDEIYRIIDDNGYLFVTIPAEGGIMLNHGRFFSSTRHFKKLGINYKKYIKIEHCNRAKEIMNKLRLKFEVKDLKFYPFLIPSINLNLIINGVFTKRKNRI